MCPTPVTVYNPGCPFYYNYFYGTDFSSNGGHWNNYTGAIGTYIEYRFTTRDGGAYVMRHQHTVTRHIHPATHAHHHPHDAGWWWASATSRGRP